MLAGTLLGKCEWLHQRIKWMQSARPSNLARLGDEDRCRGHPGHGQVAALCDLPTLSERFTAYIRGSGSLSSSRLGFSPTADQRAAGPTASNPARTVDPIDRVQHLWVTLFREDTMPFQ